MGEIWELEREERRSGSSRSPPGGVPGVVPTGDSRPTPTPGEDTRRSDLVDQVDQVTLRQVVPELPLLATDGSGRKPLSAISPSLVPLHSGLFPEAVKPTRLTASS